ncbi:polysaccharide deacetylase family protein [Paraburkholderia silviterrae]|uniref:Polysaccharide deacetylase family protein n=1 Tax=Paraburkholderia silviterrae TaxID=2528715 RepID=A0A4V6PJ18_9BURK|nr:polysaccharide deacetylase family protein [Paraburkholderia silviterrae]TDG19849.1 polysaccharide deacetylase family protein [Paraburkholderia silviterrae]
MNTPSPLASHPGAATPGAARRWRPAPLITGAAALHAGAAAALLAQPSTWPWAAGGVIASHLALTAAGLWPKSALLGPNWTRLPEIRATAPELALDQADGGADRRIALTIDDGPDPDVTPRVLDLLDQYGARATFFCIGDLARRHPRWIEAIVARGHAVENHSQRHRHTFSLSGPGALLREIEAAQQTLTEISGMRPLFFRAPAGLRNPFLEPVLCGLGLQLASWTRRGFDTRERDARKVAQRLLHGLAARDILLVHDGHAARGPNGQPVVLAALPEVLRAAADAQLHWTTLREALGPALDPALATAGGAHLARQAAGARPPAGLPDRNGASRPPFDKI